MSLILTLESTCDETAAAVIDEQLQVRGACIATQTELHAEFQGVVPEIAARAHFERMLPVIDTALRQARATSRDLAAIAVATTPGLANSLLMGLVAAKTLALAWDRPLIAINHLHAHIFACQMASSRSIYPCVGFIVSGGHTHLYDFPDALHPKFLGGTIDDAAGEAFDKVANMLNLGFPGGPALSQLARLGDRSRYDFPKSFWSDETLNFSFSGLKTAVRYTLSGYGPVDFRELQVPTDLAADVAASFEWAVVQVLVRKALQAIRQTGRQRLCVGGGVAANQVFRQYLAESCQAAEVEWMIAPPELCTDNAVMGAIAWEKFWAGEFSSLALDIEPGLVRN